MKVTNPQDYTDVITMAQNVKDHPIMSNTPPTRVTGNAETREILLVPFSVCRDFARENDVMARHREQRGRE